MEITPTPTPEEAAAIVAAVQATLAAQADATLASAVGVAAARGFAGWAAGRLMPKKLFIAARRPLPWQIG